jgi:pilus assembly protein Flp/PilA
MDILRKRFAKDDSGATAIEYGLIGALISIAIAVGATSIGTTIASTFVALGQAAGSTAP